MLGAGRQPSRSASGSSLDSELSDPVSFVTDFARDELQQPRLLGPAGAKTSSMKYTALTLFLLGTVGDQVLIKRATYAANFPSALTLLTALLGVVVYPLVVLAAILSGSITKEQIKVPWWKPAVVAFCFSLHHTLLNAGAGGKDVPGVIVSVLVKLVVPMAMFLNMPLQTLGLRYKASHWGGLVVLLVGILITVGNRMDGVSVHWSATGKMCIIALSTVPLAASFTFIEVQLKQVHPQLFAVALWMWSCLFMSVISIALLPLSAVLTNVPLDRMIADLGDGLSCYVLGRNPEGAEVSCGAASASWWLAMMFTLTYNLAMPVSTRHGGAALMWFVRAVSVPLTGLLFATTWLMGDHAVPLSVSQMYGLLVVMLGVALFNVQEPTERLEKAVIRGRSYDSSGVSMLNRGLPLPVIVDDA